MPGWNLIAIFTLFVAVLCAVAWMDKGQYLYALASGQCRACPAPAICIGAHHAAGCNPLPAWRNAMDNMDRG